MNNTKESPVPEKKDNPVASKDNPVSVSNDLKPASENPVSERNILEQASQITDPAKKPAAPPQNYSFLYSSDYWIKIIVITAIYYFTARIGQLMAIPPGNVTPVWPPSGIGLAVILLYGYRVWPIIFIGAFIDFVIIHFTGDWSTMLGPTLTAFGIATACTLQGLAGGYLVTNFGNIDDPFGKAKDVTRTLLLGAVSCLVASTIGVTTLCLAGMVPWKIFFDVWWTWYLGDTAGIFVFTPLIWVWVRYPLQSLTRTSVMEVVMLLACITLLGVILLTGPYPIIFTLIPPMVWAAFRFGYHGATATIFLTAAIAIWGTTHGAISFKGKTLNESLLLLQSFIGVSTLLTLILASTVAERFRAFLLLEDANRSLENKVKERTKELEASLQKVQGMQQQIIVQEKLASLGQLTAGIAHEIKNPLNFVNNFADLCEKQIAKMKTGIEAFKERLNPEENASLQKNFATLEGNMKKIHQYGIRADSILGNMLAHSRGERATTFQATDLNDLLEENFKLAYHAKRAQDSTFNINMQMKFDDDIGKVDILPQDFGRVILNLLNNAFYAVHQKKKELGERFFPTVTITSKNAGQDKVLVSIHDNGPGIPKEVIEKLFTPFFTTKPPGEGTGLGLSLSREVITGGHQGELNVDTKPGEYTLFTIIIPKKAIHKK